MKKLKLFLIVIVLIVANLYVFTTIAFNIKYSKLIDDYNNLNKNYQELEAKYFVKEEQLKEAMASNQNNDENIKEKLTKDLNLNKILETIDLKSLKEIIKRLDVSILKNNINY